MDDDRFYQDTGSAIPDADHTCLERATSPQQQNQNASKPQLSSNVHEGFSEPPLTVLFETETHAHPDNPYVQPYVDRDPNNEHQHQPQSGQLDHNPADPDDTSSYSYGNLPSLPTTAQYTGIESPSLPLDLTDMIGERTGEDPHCSAPNDSPSSSERAGIPGEAEDNEGFSFRKPYLDLAHDLKNEKLNNVAIVARLRVQLDTAQQDLQREQQSNTPRRLGIPPNDFLTSTVTRQMQEIASLKLRAAKLDQDKVSITAKHEEAIERYKRRELRLELRVTGMEKNRSLELQNLKDFRKHNKSLEQQVEDVRAEKKQLRATCAQHLTSIRKLEKQLEKKIPGATDIETMAKEMGEMQLESKDQIAEQETRKESQDHTTLNANDTLQLTKIKEEYFAAYLHIVALAYQWKRNGEPWPTTRGNDDYIQFKELRVIIRAYEDLAASVGTGPLSLELNADHDLQSLDEMT